MIRRKSSRSLLVFILIASILLWSCGNKVTVTRSYIYSTSWARGEYQGFQIAKIKLKDSSVSVFDKNFNHYFLDEHIVDSSVCFHIMSNRYSRNREEKIHFDIENIDKKWYRCFNRDDGINQIGLLDYNTWYIITGLGGTTDYYVYIDKIGKAHSYALGPTNW